MIWPFKRKRTRREGEADDFRASIEGLGISSGIRDLTTMPRERLEAQHARGVELLIQSLSVVDVMRKDVETHKEALRFLAQTVHALSLLLEACGEELPEGLMDKVIRVAGIKRGELKVTT